MVFHLKHWIARKIEKYILRTTLDGVGVWKAKYSKNASPFTEVIDGVSKYAAVVDKEVWVTEGGAASVTTDDTTKHVFLVGSNDGTSERKFKTNLHLAKLKI